MGFDTELVVRELREAHIWKLTEDLVYDWNGRRLTVPADTKTDFASVPKPVQWIVPRHGRYNKAAVLHDYLATHGDDVDVSRCDTDHIFRQAMMDLEVPFIRRWVMWGAVRWGAKLTGCAVPEFLKVIAITIVALPVVAPGTLIVVASHFLYQFVEYLAYGIRRLLGLVPGVPSTEEPAPKIKMYGSP